MRALALSFLLACTSATLATPPAPTDTTSPTPTPEDTPTVDAAVPETSHDASPTSPSGPISLVVEPSDNGAALLAEVKSAQTSIHVTMYLLTDSRFVDALVARKKTGVDVKVVLNHSPDNEATYSQLGAAGVSVVWAPSTFTLTHEKCIVIDATTAWIMTMNLASSSPQNREYLIRDEHADDVAEAEAIFAADFGNQTITPTGSLVVSPVNARDSLLALVTSAKSTVDLEGEELSDPKIVNALIAAKSAGLAVRVVLAKATASPAQTTAISQLGAASIPVVAVGSPYIHAKTLVVDGARAYVGSENFSTASLLYNRELGLVVDDPSIVSTIGKTVAKDFTAGSAL